VLDNRPIIRQATTEGMAVSRFLDSCGRAVAMRGRLDCQAVLRARGGQRTQALLILVRPLLLIHSRELMGEVIQARALLLVPQIFFYQRVAVAVVEDQTEREEMEEEQEPLISRYLQQQRGGPRQEAAQMEAWPRLMEFIGQD